VNALRDADGRYLETQPAQRMTLEFAPLPPAAAGGESTTYFINWQGYYREWIRGQWLAAPRRSAPWVPGDSAVLAALARWRARHAAFEREFYSTRIPVQ
jgi:hypothetical protein